MLDRFTGAVCALLLTWTVATGASARETPHPAPDDSREQSAGAAAAGAEEAAQRYDRGLELYSEGELQLAVIEFERAHQLVSDYRTLYNIGQVRIQLGHYARAHEALTAYLEQGADEISAERRDAVGGDLRMLATRVATLSIELNVAGATVSVDGAAVGVSPLPGPILVNAGPHEVTAKLAGYQGDTAQITLAGQDVTRVSLELELITKSTPQIIVKPVAPPPESNRETWKWAAWTATGMLAVGSGVTTLLGVRAANDLADKRVTLGESRPELDSASSRARTLLGVADVLGALAILSGGTALYITLSDAGTPDEQAAPSRGNVQLTIHPTQVTLGGSY